MTREQQVLENLDHVYRTGAIPLASYVERARRSACLIWQRQLYAWRKGNREIPIVCGFPQTIDEATRRELPDTDILLDMTAVLTLGSLNAGREILDALHRDGRAVFLFPGARQWLEQDVAELSWTSLPAYRARYKRLHDTLLAARDRVEILTQFDAPKPMCQETVRQRLGLIAWDVEQAIERDCLYIGNALDADIQTQ